MAKYCFRDVAAQLTRRKEKEHCQKQSLSNPVNLLVFEDDCGGGGEVVVSALEGNILYTSWNVASLLFPLHNLQPALHRCSAMPALLCGAQPGSLAGRRYKRSSQQTASTLLICSIIT